MLRGFPYTHEITFDGLDLQSFCYSISCNTAMQCSTFSETVAYFCTIYISSHFHFSYLLKWNIKPGPGTWVIAIRYRVPKTGSVALQMTNVNNLIASIHKCRPVADPQQAVNGAGS